MKSSVGSSVGDNLWSGERWEKRKKLELFGTLGFIVSHFVLGS